MTVEQQATYTTTPEGVTEQAEGHRAPLRAVIGIGQSALEGFTIMETVRSPWEGLRTQLEERIIDQPAAIDSIIDALEGSSVRMPSDKRPIANLAFLGPTGVGKSETAKSLAEFMSEGDNLVKVDCSDFSHGHEITSLTGAPPSYVGYGNPPIFRKENIEGRRTVVLFDEIEKGSDQLNNLMLQIMEDGELQLKDGQTTSFRDAIIVMTSNLGAREMTSQLSSTSLGFSGPAKQVDTTSLDEVAKRSFGQHFRPEFVNRLSRMVVFHPLGREGLGRVLDAKLTTNNTDYERHLGLRVNISNSTREFLVGIAAEQKHMGARPLVRAMDDHIGTILGRYCGADAIPVGTLVKVFHAEELGVEVPKGESPLIFASKPDDSIHKEAQFPAIMPTEVETSEEEEQTA